MSYFGDDTPEQEMLDWIDMVKCGRQLTNIQVAGMLAKLIVFWLEEACNYFSYREDK